MTRGKRSSTLFLKTESIFLTLKSIWMIWMKSWELDLFTALQIDPVEGFQFVDGTSFSREQLTYRDHLIFTQVYDEFVASHVKLTLLEDLPFDYDVYIVEAAGSRDERITMVSLEDLDREVTMSNLTSIYVPPAGGGLLNHTFPALREMI